MRTPFQEQRDIDTSRLRLQIAEGFRFLWKHPISPHYGLGNFTSRVSCWSSSSSARSRDCLLLALWGTLSPSIRNAPSLDELDEP